MLYTRPRRRDTPPADTTARNHQMGNAMRRLFFAASIAALLATGMPAAHAAVHSATDSKQVYWVLTGDVADGKLDDFKALVHKIVAGVARHEPGALEYEYNVSADGKSVQIFERYSNSAAVVTHIDNLGKSYLKEFLALLKPTALVVYGHPDESAKKAIAGLNPVYLTPFDGFTR